MVTYKVDNNGAGDNRQASGCSQKAEFVTCDLRDPSWYGRAVYAADLLETSGGIVRHDARKLAALIMRIVSGEQEPDPCPAD